MSPSSNEIRQSDPLLEGLARLPDPPVDPALSESLRRKARIAFVDANANRAPGPLALMFSERLLPAFLLVSVVVYGAHAVQLMARIYLHA